MNAQTAMTKRPERSPIRGSLAGPAVLIGLGIVFLLNNLGYLGWGIWDTLLRLWPVLLIAVGLDLLIGRRSALGSALLALLVVAALGAAIWWTGLPPTPQLHLCFPAYPQMSRSDRQ
jgi:lia operon protein LiaF